MTNTRTTESDRRISIRRSILHSFTPFVLLSLSLSFFSSLLISAAGQCYLSYRFHHPMRDRQLTNRSLPIKRRTPI